MRDGQRRPTARRCGDSELSSVTTRARAQLTQVQPRRTTGWCLPLALYSGQRDTRSAPWGCGVTASEGQRQGDVEIRNFLRNQAGSRSLVFDLSITHDRYGSSSHPLQNGRLTHPQDIDAPLHIAAQRKINSYLQQCADNQNTFFLPAIMSTSTRMHGEFCVFFFYRPTRRPRRTSLPLECHRNATNRNRSVSSMRHSTSR